MADTGFADLGSRRTFKHTLTADTGVITLATVDELGPGGEDCHNKVRKLRVTALDLNLSAAGTITFRSAANTVGNLRRSEDNLVANLPRNADGWFEDGEAGKAYTLDVGSLTVTGTVTFVKL